MNEYVIVYEDSITGIFRETYITAESEEAAKKKFRKEIGRPILLCESEEDWPEKRWLDEL
ncbi:hypothetical protein [Clostridium sp. BJN0013]|uniref:hypothetical protein n=1 Tax=Clostridium sp. BJN0013 TaxID=3236840 RepID=UPI0034C6A300